MKKLILFVLFSLSLQAAIPTMEGLFRNGGNEEISGNLVTFDLMVTEQPRIQEVEAKPRENFLKLVFFQEEDKSINLIQFQYPDLQMSDQRISHFIKVTNLLSKLKNDPKEERAVFYSILNMLGFNNSKPISTLLKKYNPDFKFNREILNGEKMALFRSYKTYLMDENKSSLPSPLNPLKEDEKLKVDEIMKSSMYKPTGNVKLVKKDGNFYWLVDLSRGNAYFSNENHFIKEMKILLAKGSIEMDFDDYVPLNGSQYLPSQIMVKDSNERFYKIKIVNFKISQTTSSKLGEKYKDLSILGASPADNSFPITFLFL